jgi:biopolymer transport protein ExbB
MTTAIKITLILSGLLSVIGPAVGMIGTTTGMMGAFNTFGTSGISNPDQLSANISTTLFYTALGTGIGVVSFITFLSVLIYWLCTRSTQKVNAAEQGAAANP